MRREKGFSLIELLVAMVIMTIIVGAAVSALVQAQNTTNAIAQEAGTQENIRAGMHFLVRDLMQAGEGIPVSGISIPSTAAGVSAINRPGTVPPVVFPNNPTSLAVVTPGYLQGQQATTVSAQTGVVSL